MSELVPASGQALANPQALQLAKARLMPKAPDADFQFFLEFCRAKGLDPFSGDILPVQYAGKYVWQMTIAGYRHFAHRTGRYSHTRRWYKASADSEWTDLPIPKPAYCKAEVFLRDLPEPEVFVVSWAEFGKTGNTWNQMPAHMLGKVAESLALRAAFSRDLGGTYTKEELEGQGQQQQAAAQQRRENLPPAAPAPAEVEDVTALVSQVQEAASKAGLQPHGMRTMVMIATGDPDADLTAAAVTTLKAIPALLADARKVRRLNEGLHTSRDEVILPPPQAAEPVQTVSAEVPF